MPTASYPVTWVSEIMLLHPQKIRRLQRQPVDGIQEESWRAIPIRWRNCRPWHGSRWPGKGSIRGDGRAHGSGSKRPRSVSQESADGDFD